MHDYWREFSYIAIAHLLAVASPGPDFAMVLRQSIAHDRKTAVWSSIGIGSGILVHVAYSLLGIGLLLKSSQLAFTILKFAGAAYIAWIGLQALRSPKRSESPLAGGAAAASAAVAPTPRAAWTAGFLTNALNPKATLFFVALFPIAVSPHTPKVIQAGYGLWMAAATAIWFSLVSFVFTREDVRRKFLQHGHWIDRTLGVVLIAFAVRLAFATID